MTRILNQSWLWLLDLRCMEGAQKGPGCVKGREWLGKTSNAWQMLSCGLLLRDWCPVFQILMLVARAIDYGCSDRYIVTA
jgi:hypothetical protein